MEFLNQDNVRELIDTEIKGSAVTVYIPMTSAGSSPGILEKQTRFRDLMKQAATRVEEKDPSSKLLKEFKQKEAELMADDSFWQDQTQGLLICASEGVWKTFHLPYETEEYVSVNDSYFLAPVLSILSDAQDYYVLTIVQQNPKLFKGDMYGLREADLTLPKDIIAADHIDEKNQKSENQGSAVGSSMNTGWYNGRGGAKNPQENDRMKYFRIIDNAVNKFVHDNTPLILAGIDSEIAEYRGMSKYPNILQTHIGGSHGDARAHQLLAEAQHIIEEEVVRPAHQAAIESYENIHGAFPERSADNKADIVEAAEQGRVGTLLVRITRATTNAVKGTLDAATRITFPDPEMSETLNQLAIKVWKMSGKIIGLSNDEMPHGAPMLAQLRY